jgi:hypothetical protein
MDLHLLSDDQRRAHCRRELEALEHWLRRLIHETFSAAHGTEYLGAMHHGGRVIKKEVADAVADRRAKEPGRYSRSVDAAHLGDLVTIICNPENWQHHFGAALREAFPLGAGEARFFLGRLVGVRNKLSHANPISVHEAARVICYTMDVTEALKGHYMNRNLGSEYNVPTIIRITDSLGNVLTATPPNFITGDFSATPLRPGDCFSIEAEIDPTFERSGYRVKLKWSGQSRDERHEDSERAIIHIENRHVREAFDVQCMVISTREWHKFGDFDDFARIRYKVLPPLS